MYSIDTNIFLDWWVRRYPADVFPSVQTKIEALIVAGKWVAVGKVADEIEHVGTKALKAWVKANKGQFCAVNAAILAEANAISSAFPGLIDPYARHDEADRYVIALAKLNGWAVVSHETPAHAKRNAVRTHYVPDVCSTLNVACIDLLELMRREKWVFK
jgi:hypothetical protein